MSDDSNKPAKPFNLNMHTARLLMREPFFAALSRYFWFLGKIGNTYLNLA